MLINPAECGAQPRAARGDQALSVTLACGPKENQSQTHCRPPFPPLSGFDARFRPSAKRILPASCVVHTIDAKTRHFRHRVSTSRGDKSLQADGHHHEGRCCCRAADAHQIAVGEDKSEYVEFQQGEKTSLSVFLFVLLANFGHRDMGLHSRDAVSCETAASQVAERADGQKTCIMAPKWLHLRLHLHLQNAKCNADAGGEHQSRTAATPLTRFHQRRRLASSKDIAKRAARVTAAEDTIHANSAHACGEAKTTRQREP
ncbi:hypothetical protein V8C26DRAFT_123160 [Trichoderma gracile]